MARPDLTHCPHCGKKLWDERLDERGFPLLDSVWEHPKDNFGPGVRLIVREVEPGNRFDRHIRGRIEYKTKKSGTEYDVEGAQMYSTSIDIFHKIWARDSELPVDRSSFMADIS